MAAECNKPVTFLLDGVEACATGTFNPGVGSSTAMNLVIDGGAALSLVTQGGIQRVTIPAGAATYTSADGTVYSSTSGELDVSDNATSLDATFFFDAANAAGETISITAGVVVDLPQ